MSFKAGFPGNWSSLVSYLGETCWKRGISQISLQDTLSFLQVSTSENSGNQAQQFPILGKPVGNVGFPCGLPWGNLRFPCCFNYVYLGNPGFLLVSLMFPCGNLGFPCNFPLVSMWETPGFSWFPCKRIPETGAQGVSFRGKPHGVFEFPEWKPWGNMVVTWCFQVVSMQFPNQRNPFFHPML